jgi:hypothetical protein
LGGESSSGVAQFSIAVPLNAQGINMISLLLAEDQRPFRQVCAACSEAVSLHERGA